MSSAIATGKVLRRIELAVDLDSYPKAQEVEGANLFVPSDLPRQVIEDRVVDEMFWYYDEIGAADYLNLAQDPRYKLLTESKHELGRRLGVLWDEADAFFRRQNVPQGLSLVALGVGSSEKEREVLRHLILYGGAQGTAADPTEYIPIDTSFPLLQRAIRLAIADPELSREVDSGRISIRPALADFRELSREYLSRRKRTLIALFGIVWNLDVANVVESLSRMINWIEAEAHSKCVVLMDCEFLDGKSDATLTAPYDLEEVRLFCRHPLDVLYQASLVKAATFEMRGKKGFHYHDYFHGYAPGEGSVEVEVVGARTVDSFIRKLGLNEAVAKRFLLGGGVLEQSKTVVIWFKPAGWKEGKQSTWPEPQPVLLGYSTKFEKGEFVKLLRDHHLNPSHRFSQGTFDIVSKLEPGSETEELQVPRPEEYIPTVSDLLGLESTPHPEVGATFDFSLETTPGRLGSLLGRSTIVVLRIARSAAVEQLIEEARTFSANFRQAKFANPKVRYGIVVLPYETRPDMVPTIRSGIEKDPGEKTIGLVRNPVELEQKLRSVLADSIK